MPSINAQTEFLRKELLPLLKTVPAGARGRWGVMNGQQMVEHLADAFRNMYGFGSTTVVTPADILPKMQAFLASDKPFRPDTRNPVLPETPPPSRCATMDESLQDLASAIDAFFDYFEEHPAARVVNPVFGSLDFDGHVRLLYKHAKHHLEQFGAG